jgi:stress-induced morphogen
MPIAKEKLETILKQNFPNAVIEITSLVDDGDHYSVTICDNIFTGKSRVEQHKMVNNALGKILGGELHALQIKTSSN